MPDGELLEIDPATLHLPGSRRDGADPIKLHRQLMRHGLSIEGMPPIDVSRGTDGGLVINDGVTRATRAAKFLPGTPVSVVVTGSLPVPVGGMPTVRDRL
jgi:hypothetical protein